MGDDLRSDGNLDEALQALPIFPLPGTVFFPHTLLPLHVFEPRYRQMTEHVLAGHQHMGVVLIDDSAGPVRGVARVAGLGKLVHSERLADGRFHILLQGMGRVALDDELPAGGLLFRRVKSRVLHCAAHPDESADVAREVQTLRSCYARMLDLSPDAKDTLGDLPLRVQDPAVLADIVCAAVLDDPPTRQRALEMTSIPARLRAANDALAALLLGAMNSDPADVH